MNPRFFFHPATPEGEGGLAVVELYGDGSRPALEALFRPRNGRLPEEGEVRLGDVTDPGGSAIDEVLLSRFTSHDSWCRLPGWALSSHGGAWVSRRLREALTAAGGGQLDRPGVVELALSAGVLDSLEADALILLPGCRTERAARYLLRMAAGELSSRLEESLEAAEGGGLPAARAALASLLESSGPAGRLFDPLRVLIAGRPNAGKSSLFNRLAERERAVVTPVPGTTRDLLEETVAIAGYPVCFLDSAGLRPAEETGDPVEREGIRRARSAGTDAVLFLVDHPGALEKDEREFLSRKGRGTCLIVRSKADLHGPRARAGRRGEECCVSALTGAGLEALRERVRSSWLGPGEEVELEAAPFTAPQRASFLEACRAPSVDAFRTQVLEWLERSPSSRDSAGLRSIPREAR